MSFSEIFSTAMAMGCMKIILNNFSFISLSEVTISMVIRKGPMNAVNAKARDERIRKISILFKPPTGEPCAVKTQLHMFTIYIYIVIINMN